MRRNTDRISDRFLGCDKVGRCCDSRLAASSVATTSEAAAILVDERHQSRRVAEQLLQFQFNSFLQVIGRNT